MNKFANVKATLQSKVSQLKSSFVPRNDGKALEEQVARLLRKEGYRKVDLNTRVKDSHGNWSEIDVIGKDRSFYNRFFTTSRVIPYGNKEIYVECKQYNPDLRVSLGDVSKFKEVLQLNQIALDNGLFVTTSTFVPRAGTIGIKTVDGSQFKKWTRAYAKQSPLVGQLKDGATMLTAIAIVWVCYLAVIELRSTRTKTLPMVDDVNRLSDFQAFTDKYGFDGYTVTSGKPIGKEFPTTKFLIDYISYLSQLAYYKVTDQNTSSLIAPKLQPKDPYATPTIAIPPKLHDTYIAYEFHQPLPLKQPNRANAMEYIKQAYKGPASYIPQSVLDAYHIAASQRDYIVIKTITESDTVKFLLSRLSNEYLTVEQGGSTIFKLPVHHMVSVPGYFLPYMKFRASQLSALFEHFTSTMQKNLHDPKSSPAHESAVISSAGNLAVFISDEPHEVYATTKPFEIVTSDASFGDNYFTHAANVQYDPRNEDDNHDDDDFF